MAVIGRGALLRHQRSDHKRAALIGSCVLMSKRQVYSRNMLGSCVTACVIIKRFLLAFRLCITKNWTELKLTYIYIHTYRNCIFYTGLSFRRYAFARSDIGGSNWSLNGHLKRDVISIYDFEICIQLEWCVIITLDFVHHSCLSTFESYLHVHMHCYTGWYTK